MHDLKGFPELSKEWSDLSSTGIAEALAAVLAKELGLALVYVQLVHPVEDRLLEVVLSENCPDAEASVPEVKAAISALIGATSSAPIATLTDPFGSGNLRATVVPIAAIDPKAVIVAAAQRANFPSEDDLILLRLAASQAAISFQRKHTERELKASREHLRAVLDSAGDGIYVMGADTKCTYLNPIGAAMLGYETDELVGRSLHGLIHHTHVDGRHHPVNECPIFLASQEGTPARVDDDVFWRKDGTPVPVTYSVAPIMVDGAPAGAVVNYRDISDRKNAEAEQARLLRAVEESEEKTALLLEAEKQQSVLMARVANASKTMGIILSLDSVARVLTEEARSILGAHQAVTSLSVSNDWAQNINAVSLSEKYAAYRSYSPKPDGTGIYSEVCRTNRPMRLTQQELEAHPAWKGFGKHAKEHPVMRGWLAVPLIGQGGKNLGLVQLSDKYVGEFTEHDEAILVQLAAIAATGIENSRLYEQVREQDRRKDEFLATLAHELRNPLAPIRTGLTLLNLAPSLEATLKTREIMERQVDHMVHLIDDLLDVSRITTGKVTLKRERIDVRTIFDSALELTRPLIEENGHEMAVSMCSEPLVLAADPTRMAQVVSNLLNNAAKYTRRGGRIELSVERVGSDAMIEVRDNGVGLTEEMLPRVFELFCQVGRTLDRSQGGLGIGLALVKRLVELHGGEISAHSAGIGQGSSFRIRLPLAATSGNEDLNADQSPRQRTSTDPLRILVVDDNIDAAEMLATLLALDGHAVQTVHTGTDALVAARNSDLLFLDIGLPGMSGYDVARELRSDCSLSDVKLVAVTGWGGLEDRRRTRDAGFDYHLTKPVQSDTLREIIERVSSAKPHASPRGQRGRG